MKDWDGEGDRAHSMAFFGWCLSTTGKARKIELYLHGTLMAAAPISLPRPDVVNAQVLPETPLKCGFHLRLSKFLLPPEAVLDIQLWEERAGGLPARHLLGTISGLPSAGVMSHYTERYQPLLVLGMGRSGTTHFMRMLASHPDILVPGPYPFEMRQPAWLWHAAQVMSSPGSQLSISPDGFEAREAQRLGYNPYRGRVWEKHAGSDSAVAWQEEVLPIECIDFCKRQVDAFVDRCAEGRAAPPMFVAQKMLISPARYLVTNVYRGGREVFLVRDFRDVWLSARSFNRKRGDQAFERDKFSDDLAWLRGLAFSSRQIRQAHASAGSRAQLVRYEDLMGQPHATMTRMLDQIGVDASPLRVRDVIADPDEDFTAETADHRTSTSHGTERWRREMTAEEQTIAAEAFGDDLRYFGYEV